MNQHSSGGANTDRILLDRLRNMPPTHEPAKHQFELECADLLEATAARLAAMERDRDEWRETARHGLKIFTELKQELR